MNAPATDPLVPTLVRFATSWPLNDEGDELSYMPLSEALASRWADDAHFAAYSVPERPVRLSKEAVQHPQLPAGVTMVLVIFDVDGPGHADGEPATDAWWSDFKARAQALLEVHTGGFIYRTRGGARIVYLLPSPTALRSFEDANTWRLYYLASLAYLEHRFGIAGDPRCSSWTGLQRLPHATRKAGSEPEDLEVIGEASAIGPWAPEVTAADMLKARVQLAKRLPESEVAPPSPEPPHWPPMEERARRGVAYLTGRDPARETRYRKPGDDRYGDRETYIVCRHLVRELVITDEELVFRLLWELWNPRCQPPWDEAGLRRKIREARGGQVRWGAGYEFDRLRLVMQGGAR